MAERIDNQLIYVVLKDVQARLASLEGMRAEMRDGFASLRAHLATQHGDAAFPERRVIELEKDMERVKRRLELAEETDGS
jgi:septal ring factor EnvC (AmiA/AmiB activator)